MDLVEPFVRDGYGKVESLVPRAIADEARALLWQRIGLSPDDPSTWTRPVIWTADQTGEGPFGHIIHSDVLTNALDTVIGPGAWVPRGSLGNIPIRFPAVPPADDRGRHIDASVATSDGTWAVTTRPETVLLLVLLSEAGPDDAPTRIRVGSQREVPNALPDGKPIDVFTAGPIVDQASRTRPLGHATGLPGDAYLLHPFTVHAAQAHHGTRPRFMAQLPIFLTKPFDPTDDTPLTRATRRPQH